MRKILARGREVYWKLSHSTAEICNGCKDSLQISLYQYAPIKSIMWQSLLMRYNPFGQRHESRYEAGQMDRRPGKNI